MFKPSHRILFLILSLLPAQFDRNLPLDWKHQNQWIRSRPIFGFPAPLIKDQRQSGDSPISSFGFLMNRAFS